MATAVASYSEHLVLAHGHFVHARAQSDMVCTDLGHQVSAAEAVGIHMQ